MPPAPLLRLTLADAYDAPLGVEADVRCRNMITGSERTFRSVAGRTLVVSGLEGGANGVYRVEADPSAYLPSGAFVSLRGSGTTEATIHFAVDPSRVSHVTFPAFADLQPQLRRLLGASRDVAGFGGVRGQALYDALDDLRRAGLLTIAAKCRATPIGRRRVVLSQLTALREIRGDRCFAVVPPTLFEAVSLAEAGGLFEAVSGALHPPPVGAPGASLRGSFKTRDAYGNLQLTFFEHGPEWIADIDIDDAGGLAHVFQVLRHALGNRPTHPYDIHEILMRHQQLDAGYRFHV